MFVAPTIVNTNFGGAGSVVTFGNIGSYTYNPWGTLPYLQLPGWTVQAVYAMVGGLFIIYIFGLLGSNIPGVGEFFNTLSSKYRQSQ